MHFSGVIWRAVFFLRRRSSSHGKAALCRSISAEIRGPCLFVLAIFIDEPDAIQTILTTVIADPKSPTNVFAPSGRVLVLPSRVVLASVAE